MATITATDTQALLYGALTGVGTFTVTVNTGTANLRIFNASVVALVTGVLNSAQFSAGPQR